MYGLKDCFNVIDICNFGLIGVVELELIVGELIKCVFFVFLKVYDDGFLICIIGDIIVFFLLLIIFKE